MAISTGLCGEVNRSSARSRIGLNTRMGQPRFAAARRVVIIRGWLVPGLWPNEKIRSAWSKSSRLTEPLPTPSCSGSAALVGLVAHVGAVGEIVGAEGATEQLPQEGRLVGGPAGGVEFRLVGLVEGQQGFADAGESLVPGSFEIFVRGRIIDQRMGQPAGVFERVIAPGPQLRHRVGGEHIGRGALAGRLPGHRLGSVLAELERRGVLGIGPGAAGAVEALRLVGAQQGGGARDHRLLAGQHAGHRLQRVPASGGLVVLAELGGRRLGLAPGLLGGAHAATGSRMRSGRVNTAWPSARARATRVSPASSAFRTASAVGAEIATSTATPARAAFSTIS